MNQTLSTYLWKQLCQILRLRERCKARNGVLGDLDFAETFSLRLWTLWSGIVRTGGQVAGGQDVIV